ncbi:hypothetical protein HKD37_19G053218 [Glycine soja]
MRVTLLSPMILVTLADNGLMSVASSFLSLGERLVGHVDLVIGKADGPNKKKLRTYLGIVARDKVDVTYETWKEVLAAQKDLIWEDIEQGEMGPVLLAADKRPSWEDVRKKEQAIQKLNTAPHVLSRGGYEYFE